MRISPASILCILAAWLGTESLPAHGGVIVVANRTRHEVRFTLGVPKKAGTAYAVAPGSLAAIAVTGISEIAFDAGKANRRYQVNVDTAYYFAEFSSGPDLKEIGLGDSEVRLRPVLEANPQPTSGAAQAMPPRVLKVKILVDQHERGRQILWEKRLRDRITVASRILEHHCGVRLEVVAAEEWQSDDNADSLAALLQDFERKVKAYPADLAIGYTSHRLSREGTKPAGVTRRALHDHILLREWWPPSERGLADVMLHELGHYLGAVHSAEPDSVMRASLGASGARPGRPPVFDPLNTLVMNLVATEMFEQHVKRLSGCSVATRSRLRAIYRELGRALPEDATASQYLRQLEERPVAASPNRAAAARP